MTGSLDWMPYRSRHSVSHLFVDGSRDQSIIHPLPHVDSPFDFRHVESPTPMPISGTKGVFALLAYDPCVRRVYQPAALPERRSE
jgi:hypothetical protein